MVRHATVITYSLARASALFTYYSFNKTVTETTYKRKFWNELPFFWKSLMLEQRHCDWNSQEFMSSSRSRRQRDMHELLKLQNHHQWHTYSSKTISLNSSKQFRQLGTNYSNMNLSGHFHISHHRFTVPWTLNLLYYSCGMLNNQNTLSGLQGKCPWTKVKAVKRVGMSYSFFMKPFLSKVP